MVRYSLSECRWRGITQDWPMVGSIDCPGLSEAAFHRFGSCSASEVSGFHTFVDDWRLESIWRDVAL
jgi:hypothetical protein